MATVVPADAVASATAAVALPGIGPGKGNGCCCACLGGDPGPVPTAAITAVPGGKFLTLDAGRVLEYYVYGSEQADATTLLQFGGNFSTGYFFAADQALGAKLAELNIRGIAISLPGVGYSSMNHGANMYHFCKEDVGRVLEAEGVSRFMLEGTSNGTMIAMGVAHAHADRLAHLYLNVPWFNKEVAALETPHVSVTDFYLPCQDRCVTSANLRSVFPGCCLHCCVNCTACCCFAMMSECEQHKETARELPELAKLQYDDTKRALKHHGAGVCLSQIFAGTAPGVDIRELAAKFRGKDKVLITWATNDAEAPPDQARALIKMFDAAHAVGDGNALKPKMADGHAFWIWRLMKGHTAELQLKQVSAPSSEAIERDINEYFQVPKPEGLSLDFDTKKK